MSEILLELGKLFSTIDQILLEWTAPGSLKMKDLVLCLSQKLDLSGKKIKEYDLLSRFYIKRSKDYIISPGINGGIRRISDLSKSSSKNSSKLESLNSKLIDIKSKSDLKFVLSNEDVDDLDTDDAID